MSGQPDLVKKLKLDNRHRAGWRLSLATRKVNTYPRQRMVTLMDIASPPYMEESADRLPESYAAPRPISGADLILPEPAENVNDLQKPGLDNSSPGGYNGV